MGNRTSVYNPVGTIVAFALLAVVVIASFAYASAYPRLGIYNAINVTPEIAQSLGLDRQYGVLVVTVEPGSPAAKAGIQGSTIINRNGADVMTQVGDIIIGADGKSIRSIDDIYSVLNSKHIGDTISLTIVRGKETHDVNVTLGQ